uniref:W2 domain-containing protein n=1 Tax=Araucaria cunninghamii TaxID=56994 RepID=A0A0D6R826_ARACU
MALQNIGAGNKDDAFYRYKMPKLMTKIEGRGNGIKTNIVNMVEVAKALGRPPSYTTKYFGCELGAQSKFDEKTGTSTVNGSHDNAKMVALLENFIKKYVQCYGCGNPETEILISKAQMISMRCAACGFISEVDMRDKLTTFILKNPPEQKKGGKEKKALRKAEKERIKQGEVLDEELKKNKKESLKKKSHDATSKRPKKKSSDEEDQSPPGSQAGDDDEANDEDDGVQWQTDTSAEAAKQRIKEQLTHATSEMVMLHIPDEDTKKGSKNKDAEKIVHEVEKNLAINNGMPASSEQCAVLSMQEQLVADFSDFLQKGKAATQLVEYMQSLSGSPQEVMTALFEALFEGIGKGFSKEVTKKKIYLAKAVQNEDSQMLLLHAVEAFCKCASADAVKEVALVLKVLYDADILEEDIILQWYDKGSVGADAKSIPMWKNVKPFTEWLRSAEAESEED